MRTDSDRIKVKSCKIDNESKSTNIIYMMIDDIMIILLQSVGSGGGWDMSLRGLPGSPLMTISGKK